MRLRIIPPIVDERVMARPPIGRRDNRIPAIIAIVAVALPLSAKGRRGRAIVAETSRRPNESAADVEFISAAECRVSYRSRMIDYGLSIGAETVRAARSALSPRVVQLGRQRNFPFTDKPRHRCETLPSRNPS